MATLPQAILSSGPIFLILTFKEEELSKATYVARTSVVLIIDVAVMGTLSASWSRQCKLSRVFSLNLLTDHHVASGQVSSLPEN